MLKYLALLLFAASAVVQSVGQPFPARPGPVIISQPGTGSSSSSGGLDTNAVIALIEEYGGGGGGAVSNAYNLTFASATLYTNNTSYAALVSGAVQLDGASGALAGFGLRIDTNANGTMDVYRPLAVSTTGAAFADTANWLAFIPSGARWAITNEGGGTVAHVANSGYINYFSTNSAGGGGGINTATVVAIMETNNAATVTSLLYSSNVTSRLRAEWRQRRLTPPMMTASYNVFPTSSIGGYTNAGLESQNYMRWATNLLYFHSTNGMRASGYDYVQIDDGWQWRTNGAGATDLVNGTTTWNTNTFPMGMPAYCDLAHSLGMKVVGYTSFTTNTCNTNGVGSPINRIYQDIHTFMSWGWDGIKFDTCGDDLGSAYANREYLKRYFRIVNQAVDDYYAIVQATNGICREFIIGTPLVYQAMDPDQSVVTTDVMDMVDWVFLNWNALSVALTENYIENIRTMAHVAMKLEAILPPGKAVGMESFYNLTPGGGYTPGKWTNVLSLYAAMAAPMIGRFATWDYGTITNDVGEPPTPNGGAPIYQLNESGRYWTNQAFLNVLRDPAGIRSSLVWSNQGVEMWRRPLGSPDLSKDCFITFSAATNSSLYHAATGSTNITVTFDDFGGRPGYRYAFTDIWTGLITEFTNTFTVTLTTNSVQAFRVTRQQEFDFMSSGVANSTLNGTPIYYHPISAAVNASQNAIAYRVPEDMMLGEFSAYVTYGAAVDTNTFTVFTNLSPTPIKAVVVVTSALNVNNLSVATTNVPVLVRAGTMLSIAATNQSATSRAIFGGWTLKYLNPKRQ
jgi:hypothetical protein